MAAGKAGPEFIEASLGDSLSQASVDVDGNDYHVAHALLSSGLHPEVFIVNTMRNSHHGSSSSWIISQSIRLVWWGLLWCIIAELVALI